VSPDAALYRRPMLALNQVLARVGARSHGSGLATALTGAAAGHSIQDSKYALRVEWAKARSRVLRWGKKKSNRWPRRCDAYMLILTEKPISGCTSETRCRFEKWLERSRT